MITTLYLERLMGNNHLVIIRSQILEILTSILYYLPLRPVHTAFFSRLKGVLHWTLWAPLSSRVVSHWTAKDFGRSNCTTSRFCATHQKPTLRAYIHWSTADRGLPLSEHCRGLELVVRALHKLVILHSHGAANHTHVRFFIMIPFATKSHGVIPALSHREGKVSLCVQQCQSIMQIGSCGGD